MSRIEQRRAKAEMFKLACGARMSLSDPLFNFREIAKQLLLLEDHLLHASKHCPDCIRKHLMTVEALAEEATSLDSKGEYTETSERLAEVGRVWLERVIDSEPSEWADVGQQVRAIRKELVQQVHDPRGPAERVASLHLARHRHVH